MQTYDVLKLLNPLWYIEYFSFNLNMDVLKRGMRMMVKYDVPGFNHNMWCIETD